MATWRGSWDVAWPNPFLLIRSAALVCTSATWRTRGSNRRVCASVAGLRGSMALGPCERAALPRCSVNSEGARAAPLVLSSCAFGNAQSYRAFNNFLPRSTMRATLKSKTRPAVRSANPFSISDLISAILIGVVIIQSLGIDFPKPRPHSAVIWVMSWSNRRGGRNP